MQAEEKLWTCVCPGERDVCSHRTRCLCLWGEHGALLAASPVPSLLRFVSSVCKSLTHVKTQAAVGIKVSELVSRHFGPCQSAAVGWASLRNGSWVMERPEAAAEAQSVGLKTLVDTFKATHPLHSVTSDELLHAERAEMSEQLPWKFVTLIIFSSVI